ncbi:MAG: hypothetical protein ACRD0K_14355 [Egibacteraceae bacterium]
MMANGNQSFAARFLKNRPDIRNQVVNSQAFQGWRSGLGTVEVDGVKYYVIGGDMLLDEDEIILQWARRSGIVSQADIDQQLKQENP